ncbi:extracellular tyrosine-protein kinase PKDCC-like [Ornithorhynchus anatinus]|uniref:extracellular tyrosine-protein kinase PKDCC-like n=1 Tax=Ornithorhynchus anatinus TaxID=9258 RepID=UPI0010A79913|nr:extracellular tyrosine-protein kinase PKDCC-like [Ornithorhynchus anatinus]
MPGPGPGAAALLGAVALLAEVWRRVRDVRRLGRPEPAGRRAGALGCEALRRLAGLRPVGAGDTKAVVRAELGGGRALALKTVRPFGPDVSRCLQSPGAGPAACRRLANLKLLKELALLQRLRHPAVVKLYGQCYDHNPDGEIGVTAILELGSPLEFIQLLQTPWEERFKICLGLVRLLHYLAHSPLGSVALLDFQPRQFVLVNGHLKVTDLDDASTEEPECQTDEYCTLDFPDRTFPGRCGAAGRCHGLNEKRNLYNAYRYFFTYLLPHTSPPALQPLLLDILNATGDLRYGINETLATFEEVRRLYESGLYLQNSPPHLKDYILLKGFRPKDSQDYRCWPSYSHLGCLLSVHDAEEAASICASHPQCQSFIIHREQTWAGRHLASFRSSMAELIPDAHSQVYRKRSGARSGEAL